MPLTVEEPPSRPTTSSPERPPVNPEKDNFPKEVILQRKKEVLESLQNPKQTPLELSLQLVHLKRAGIEVKGANRGELLQRIQQGIEEYKNKPVQLLNIINNLQYVDETIDITPYTETINKAIDGFYKNCLKMSAKNEEAYHQRPFATQLLQMYAQRQRLGIEHKVTDEEKPFLMHGVINREQTSQNIKETVLNRARLRYLGIEMKASAETTDLRKRQAEKELDKYRSNPTSKGEDFARLYTLYNNPHFGGSRPLQTVERQKLQNDLTTYRGSLRSLVGYSGNVAAAYRLDAALQHNRPQDVATESTGILTENGVDDTALPEATPVYPEATPVVTGAKSALPEATPVSAGSTLPEATPVYPEATPVVAEAEPVPPPEMSSPTPDVLPEATPVSAEPVPPPAEVTAETPPVLPTEAPPAPEAEVPPAEPTLPAPEVIPEIPPAGEKPLNELSDQELEQKILMHALPKPEKIHQPTTSLPQREFDWLDRGDTLLDALQRFLQERSSTELTEDDRQTQDSLLKAIRQHLAESENLNRGPKTELAADIVSYLREKADLLKEYLRRHAPAEPPAVEAKPADKGFMEVLEEVRQEDWSKHDEPEELAPSEPVEPERPEEDVPLVPANAGKKPRPRQVKGKTVTGQTGVAEEKAKRTQQWQTKKRRNQKGTPTPSIL
jgi:hypothetical protein